LRWGPGRPQNRGEGACSRRAMVGCLGPTPEAPDAFLSTTRPGAWAVSRVCQRPLRPARRRPGPPARAVLLLPPGRGGSAARRSRRPANTSRVPNRDCPRTARRRAVKTRPKAGFSPAARPDPLVALPAIKRGSDAGPQPGRHRLAGASPLLRTRETADLGHQPSILEEISARLPVANANLCPGRHHLNPTSLACQRGSTAPRDERQMNRVQPSPQQPESSNQA